MKANRPLASRTIRCLVLQMPSTAEYFPGQPAVAPREVSALNDPYLAALLRRLHELRDLGAAPEMELPPPPSPAPPGPLVARPGIEPPGRR